MKQQQPPSQDQRFPNTKPNLSFVTHFTTEGLPNVIAKKVAGIVEELNSDSINVASLRAFLAVGIPDEAAVIREYCWKIVLGYLPPEKSKWQATIEKEAKTYEGLVRMFLPVEKFEDYPLPLKKQHPRYAQLESDFLLWEQIEKDTSRTHAEFTFFASPSREIMIPYFTSARKEKFRLIHGEDEEDYQQFLKDKERQRKTYRYDYMSRILYIYSKLNSKIQYVQGMNEILAPIFYLVNITKPPTAVQEASCFFMFNNAICDILELHIKDLDKSKNGIYGKLHQVNQMLMVIDPVVWERLNHLKIDPFYYCFRWVTLLYAQDFALFDTIRIWESIFSSDDRLLYINLFAIAIILACKQMILVQEFTAVMETLHNIRDNLDIHQTIAIADQLYHTHQRTNFTEEAVQVRESLERQKEKNNKKEREESEKENERMEKERRKAAKEKEKLQRLEKKQLEKKQLQEQKKKMQEERKKQLQQQKKVAKQKVESTQKKQIESVVQVKQQQGEVNKQKKKKKKKRTIEENQQQSETTKQQLQKKETTQQKKSTQQKDCQQKKQKVGFLRKFASWLSK